MRTGHPFTALANWWTQLTTRTPPTDDGMRDMPPAFTAAVGAFQMEAVGWATWRFGSQAWQDEAWRLYDITGPLRFAANWVGHSVGRCRLFVADVDDTGEQAQETTDPEVAALATGPLGAGPSKDEALRVLAINLFVAGEAYIIAEADAGQDGEDRWFVVSGKKISRVGDEIKIRRPQLEGGGDMVYRPDVDLIIRVWTPHPADGDEPDSSVRSALPQLRKIELILKREYAELDSRLTGAGLLMFPQGIDFPPPPKTHPDEIPPTGVEGFTRLLMRTMATSLEERGSAESMVPIMLELPKDAIDAVQHLTFWSELSKELGPMLEAAIRQVGLSLDIPVEILLGLAEANHWTGWLVSEDAIATQIAPLAARIADALTRGYLRRALELWGREPDSQVYGMSTAPLSVKQDRSADALSFYKEGLISEAATAEAGAFREDQLPTPEERMRRFAERAILGAPTLIADPALRELVGLPPLPAPPAPVIPAQAGQPPQEQEEKPPVEDKKDIPEEPVKGDDGQAAALIPVANLAMRRALTLAGRRLVPHTQRARYAATERHQLYTCHGAVTSTKADTLLIDAWCDLAAVADDLHVDATELQALLHEHAVDLLTRGMAYDDQLLRDLMGAAVRGQRLKTLAGVGA